MKLTACLALALLLTTGCNPLDDDDDDTARVQEQNAFLLATALVIQQQQTQDTSSPRVQDETISASTLPYRGGAITLSATITDNRRLETVEAILVAPSGARTTQAMTADGNRFSTGFDIAANTTVGDGDALWRCYLRVLDGAGNLTRGEIHEIWVAGVAEPPAPPVFP